MYQQQYQHQPTQQRQQQQHGGGGAGAGGGGQNREPIDPFQARQLYRNELATLTFNSKPIITSLTISAGENASVSKVIVQTIEERLRTAPANQKLPTLYLIDSILKNVGGPYLNLFARTIVTLFLDAYAVVDTSAKASFEKVLGTWPNWTSQLFPKELIAKIEQGVRSMRQQKQGSHQPSSSHVKPHHSDRSREDPYSQNANNMHGSNGSQNRPTPPPAPIESSGDNGLLKDIQLLMLQKQHAMIMNPADQASAKQVGILQQLESLVKTTQLTPESSNIIRQQLAQLWTPAPTPPVLPVFPQGGMPTVSSPMPPNMIPGSMPPLQQPPQPPTMPLPPNMPFPPPHFPPQFQPGSIPNPHMMGAPLPMPIPPAGIPMPGGLPMPIPPRSMPIPPRSMPIPPRSMPMPMPPMPIPSMPNAPTPPTLPGAPAANLFASLMQSGLLGPNGALANLNRNPQSPMIGGTPPPPMPIPLPLVSAPGPALTPPTLDRADQSEQDRSVMSLGMIELSSQDIQRRRPAAIQVMYGTPPLQCNQCGYRCPKSADAQKKMDSHLDWHFRQNRRMKDKAKKSHSRSWLVGEEDWIHSREGDLSQSQQPVFFDFASGVNKTSKDEQALQEEIAAMKEQIVSEATLAQGLCGNDSEATANVSTLIAKGCSICKEKFIKVWNEAEEEWSYKNAVVVDKMIYHATCHADLVRSTARQAAAAAAAVATAAVESMSASSPSLPSTLPTGFELTTTAQMDIKDEDMKEDIKPELKVEGDQQALALAQDIKDHVMTLAAAAGTTDSDLPTSLKRKLEIDNVEESESASKKSILSSDS